MTTVKEAAEQLAAAATTVADVRVYTDPSDMLDPPAVVVGPPGLLFEGPTSEPTSATFPVYVVEKLAARALEKLWQLVPEVSDALDQLDDVAVVRADPGVFRSGTTDLPCYEITAEVSL